jgi:hypothetical protein
VRRLYHPTLATQYCGSAFAASIQEQSTNVDDQKMRGLAQEKIVNGAKNKREKKPIITTNHQYFKNLGISCPIFKRPEILTSFPFNVSIQFAFRSGYLCDVCQGFRLQLIGPE